MKAVILLDSVVDEVMGGIEAGKMTLEDVYEILKETDQGVGEQEKIHENNNDD